MKELNLEKLIKQVIKFGLVGVIASLIDFGLLTMLTEFFNVYYLISAAVSFVVSTIFNYIASMRFVFESKFEKKQRHKEVIIFLVLSIIGLIVNQVMMWFFVDIMNIYYIFGKVLATVIVMIWNFVSRKIWLEG